MRQMLYPQSYLHSIPMKRELLRWDSNPQHEADALPTELLTLYPNEKRAAQVGLKPTT